MDLSVETGYFCLGIDLFIGTRLGHDDYVQELICPLGQDD